MSGPVLTTQRLTLRLPLQSDMEAIHAFHSASPRAAFVGTTDDRFASWRMLLATIGHWTLRGYGWFTMVRRDGGAVVGRSGISLHDGYPECELGWHVYDGHERQGYATEAARAIRGWYRETFRAGPPISLIDPANEASKGVARKLGAAKERDAQVIGHAVEIWRHPEDAA